jgi:methionyl-tRNA formyltransferase
MDEGIDTGDLILQRWVPIEPADDAGSLATRLAEIGGPLLAGSLALAHQGRAPRRAQERGAGSYARKMTKSDGMVDWTLDAETLWHRQRAVTPWPGAVAGFQERHLILVRTEPLHHLPTGDMPGTVVEAGHDLVAIACGRGALRLVTVRPEGRGDMSAAEWARGARLKPGDRMMVEKEAHA